MQNPDLIFRQAVQAARAGKDLTARDLFLDVVKLDPTNKMAWLWLIGLLDNPDDRITACRRVLALDPSEVHARAKLEELLAQNRTVELETDRWSDLGEVEAALKKGDLESACRILRQFTSRHADVERAWLLLADASPEMAEQARALERAVRLNPKNESAKQRLQELRAVQNDPYDLAQYYEKRGETERAIETYKEIALRSRKGADVDRAYTNITRLERLRVEKIKHVSPVLSLARLTAGPPLLYFVAMMVQYGLRPWTAPWFIWLAFLVVIAGSFFSALAAVRGHFRIWEFFDEAGTRGSTIARVALGFAGAVLIVVSFAPMTSDAFWRLSLFVPPFPPW